MEIEQRLGLYQVFLKLYQHHRSLLDELLQLEKTSDKMLGSIATRCVTGVIQGQQVYLVTNLIDGKTQTLLQPQGIWTIGRDRQLAIPIPDRRLSRRHAVIQYVKNQGFYLVDLDSTNGSFINGEPVKGRLLLRDGDRVRLSSLAFSFFLCHDSHTLDEAPPDILAQLEAATLMATLATAQQPTALDGETPIAEQAEQQEETSRFLQKSSELKAAAAEFSIPHLDSDQQSEILDRFFSRQIQKGSKVDSLPS